MPARMRLVNGSVCVITGASSGIGAALATALAGHGARLVVAARRRDRLEALARDWGDCLAVTCDVSDPAQCHALIAAAMARFGRIDTVVANAGYGMFREVEHTSVADWNAIIATNVIGTSELFRAALPHLRRNAISQGWRGQCMAVSSGLARRSMPDMAAYSATKAAQLSLCESLRVEVRHERIAVTSVHPVGTDTGFGSAADAQSAQHYEKPPGVKETVQTAEHVARCMVAAMRRPRAEVWPHEPMRWAVALTALWPSLGDRIMGAHRRRPVGRV